jgi:predicted nucleotide-binding protein
MSSEFDIFSQINNAVLDLQASQLQTFERPLKTLARLLRDPSLETVNSTLISAVDFDAFLAASENTGGSMVGSHQLAWPEDQSEILGLTLILLGKLADDPGYATNFSHHYFYSGSKVVAGIHALTRQLIIPFVRDYKAYVLNRGIVTPKIMKSKSNNIFIVHGHDGEARESVARFISNIGFKPIILHEQANRGRTVIEKVEAHSDVSFAVVLLTPDDLGKAKEAADLEPRARQNVLLELGYFFGRLGRENVCALKRGEVEVPSDFAGVVWEKMDAGNGWKQALGRELEAAGHVIDWNLVMRS